MAKPANSSDVERQRKQRKNISLEDKIDIIKRKEDNTKLSDEKLANEYGVDRSTISTILRKKEKFLQLHASANYSDLKKLASKKRDSLLWKKHSTNGFKVYILRIFLYPKMY